MNSLVIDAESTVRIAVFIAAFALLAVLEIFIPRRPRSIPRRQRWFANLALSVLNTLVVRFTLPLAGVAAAWFAQERGWGVGNWLPLPVWLNILGFLLLFDLTIYLQHRLFHWQPLLWRMHRTHHTDPEYDLTTGNRFHPGSILVSAVIKITLVLCLGPVAAAVVIAEVLLNLSSMFNHSNIRIAPKLDEFLRRFIVTPDMHRIHHSVDGYEHSHNFGFNFSWWDRLFKTYLAQPQLGHTGMQIGIEGFSADASTRLGYLLLQPLKR